MHWSFSRFAFIWYVWSVASWPGEWANHILLFISASALIYLTSYGCSFAALGTIHYKTYIWGSILTLNTGHENQTSQTDRLGTCWFETPLITLAGRWKPSVEGTCWSCVLWPGTNQAVHALDSIPPLQMFAFCLICKTFLKMSVFKNSKGYKLLSNPLPII